MNVPSKEKFLYFATGAGANAADEAVCFPVSALRGMESTTATAISLYFSPSSFTSVLATDVTDTVALTVGTTGHKTVM